MSPLQRIQSMLGVGTSLSSRRTAGGIKPPSNKEHSLRSRIMPMPIPPQLKIPVGATESGTIALDIAAGDHVRKYQKLAQLQLSAQGRTSIPVHAPTSGIVSAIEEAYVADHSQQKQVCIVLKTDGLDTSLPLEPAVDYRQLASEELVTAIRRAGIVGMGGAGFPAADKIDSAAHQALDLLIINAAECEPYISADEALIRERAEGVVTGAEILQRASSARRCIIAIESSKPNAIQALEQAIEAQTNITGNCELLLVPSKYPAGSEKQLIQSVSGIEIPSGQHPAQHGVLVHNVGTSYAVFQALVLGRPCISRITTLSGQALKTPKNFEALIGCSVEFLFEICGIDKSLRHKTLLGGSLMGLQLPSDNAAVSKTTNCLIAAGSDELAPPTEIQACIRCGFCADACPVRLLPQQLLAFSKTANNSQLLEHGLMDCIECGACDYVCPSHIPLVSIYKDSKAAIETRLTNHERSKVWQQRFQYHQSRIKKEKDQAPTRTKAVPAKKPAAESEVSASNNGDEQEFFSKEKASREIAAAVARVKARRDESKKAASVQDKSK